jgi:hypothetical protein
MARHKTSKRKVISVSLNPINEAEARVMELIDEWAKEDVTLKEWVVDRMLRDDGATPERYAPQINADAIAASVAGSLEEMFHAFAVELMETIGDRPVGKATPKRGMVEDDEVIDDERQQIIENFTDSFLARRRRK